MARWREKINDAASVYGIFELFGGRYWLALAGGLIQGWLASLHEAFVLFMVPSAILTIGVILWVFNLLDAHRRARMAQRPDYALWDGHEEFSTWDAACLWDDKPLTSPALTDRGLKIMREIKNAINEGKVRARNSGPSGANRSTLVTREQLRAFAGMRSERPKFLFKDAR